MEEAEDECGDGESGTDAEAFDEDEEEIAAEDDFLADIAPEKQVDGVEGFGGGEVAWFETKGCDEPEGSGDESDDENCAKRAEEEPCDSAARRCEAES